MLWDSWWIMNGGNAKKIEKDARWSLKFKLPVQKGWIFKIFIQNKTQDEKRWKGLIQGHFNGLLKVEEVTKDVLNWYWVIDHFDIFREGYFLIRHSSTFCCPIRFFPRITTYPHHYINWTIYSIRIWPLQRCFGKSLDQSLYITDSANLSCQAAPQPCDPDFYICCHLQ